jgi:hypothetical protein
LISLISSHISFNRIPVTFVELKFPIILILQKKITAVSLYKGRREGEFCKYEIQLTLISSTSIIPIFVYTTEQFNHCQIHSEKS